MKLHLLHDWGAWSDPIDTQNDYAKVQSRHCKTCNRVEVKKIKQPWNQWFSVTLLKETTK